MLDTATALSNAGAGVVATAIDRGVAGVTVSAYDASGVLAGSTTSGSPTGAYTLTLAAAGPFRIEFSGLPAGYQPAFHGANNGTSVQFVPAGGAAHVDFGIALPASYCQDNPDVAVNCFYFGDPVLGDNSESPALHRFPYTSGSNGMAVGDYDAPPASGLVPAKTVGATFGLAYSRSARRLFAAAYFKKHAGFGPGGAGAVYRIDPLTGVADATFQRAWRSH